MDEGDDTNNDHDENDLSEAIDNPNKERKSCTGEPQGSVLRAAELSEPEL